jgi:hypothetical protein
LKICSRIVKYFLPRWAIAKKKKKAHGKISILLNHGSTKRHLRETCLEKKIKFLCWELEGCRRLDSFCKLKFEWEGVEFLWSRSCVGVVAAIFRVRYIGRWAWAVIILLVRSIEHLKALAVHIFLRFNWLLIVRFQKRDAAKMWFVGCQETVDLGGDSVCKSYHCSSLDKTKLRLRAQTGVTHSFFFHFQNMLKPAGLRLFPNCKIAVSGARMPQPAMTSLWDFTAWRSAQTLSLNRARPSRCTHLMAAGRECVRDPGSWKSGRVGPPAEATDLLKPPVRTDKKSSGTTEDSQSLALM